jgi:hypothetical protein
MSTLVVGLSAGFECSGEIKGPQLLGDVSHVVVEVTTYNYRSIGVLSDNVPHNLRHSCCSVLQVLLLSRLEITVENLNVLVAEFQLSPTEVCPKCLHKLQSGVGS